MEIQFSFYQCIKENYKNGFKTDLNKMSCCYIVITPIKTTFIKYLCKTVGIAGSYDKNIAHNPKLCKTTFAEEKKLTILTMTKMKTRVGGLEMWFRERKEKHCSEHSQTWL